MQNWKQNWQNRKKKQPEKNLIEKKTEYSDAQGQQENWNWKKNLNPMVTIIFLGGMDKFKSIKLSTKRERERERENEIRNSSD